ncbi:TetR/AcrR family transcriptional regulator [Antrihabitans cavernicola]|uniref:Helix-turn-helix transcriptional regulator n=1 Tax=Antrihabitans cavernicola TaxID=2495913 RepID=A0A5A7SG04_9NOCA|nr:TetR/AcrR family transcriptional regulator [Spelaeibacter cavernicola]KAA0023563.1 helix-turn-helix transcriptional regulator [Spelaeibacter cavernicola]
MTSDSEGYTDRESVATQASTLRERKRRALRRRLSDTATAMFLERGFDNVRVSDVATACDVSTKTVWNHFATKESLLFDRGEALAETLRLAAQQRGDVIASVVAQIHVEVEQLDRTELARFAYDGDSLRMVHAFTELVQSHPALRAATAERVEALTSLGAKAVAAQWNSNEDAPQARIAGSALITLWQVHLTALLRLSDTDAPRDEVRSSVLQDVNAAETVVRRVIGVLEPR